MPFRTPGLSLPLRPYLARPLEEGARYWAQLAIDEIREQFPFFEARPVLADYRTSHESLYFRGNERMPAYVGLNYLVVLNKPDKAYDLTFVRQAQAMVLELSRGRDFRRVMREAVYGKTKISLPRISPVIGARTVDLQKLGIEANPLDPLIVLYRKAITKGMQQSQQLIEDDVVDLNPFFRAVLSVATAAYATESRASVVGSETPISRKIEGMRLDAVIPRLAQLSGVS